MRILYLSQYFPPEIGAPSARVYELARHWASLEEDVTVLTGFPNHPTGVIPDKYRGYHFLEEEKDGIRVLRTYIYAAPNKGFFKRVLSYLSFSLSSIIQGTKKVGKRDIIIATSPQFFVAVSGYIISRLKKIPFVFEVRDLWPESIVQLGQIKNKTIIKALERVEVFLYKKARHIIVVSDAFVEAIVGKGISPDKISIIKNGVDLKLFCAASNKIALKKKYGLVDKTVVSYIGTHGLSHALDNVVETANLMREQSELLFLLVGEGAEKENLKKQAQSLGLNNIRFVDQVDKAVLKDYYALSDIILVTLRKLPVFKTVIPSKVFEIMAMAKPILISVDGVARKIIEDAKSGIFVSPEDPQALKKEIERLKSDQALMRKLGQNGRSYVEKYFDRNKLADKYLEELKRCIVN